MKRLAAGVTATLLWFGTPAVSQVALPPPLARQYRNLATYYPRTLDPMRRFDGCLVRTAARLSQSKKDWQRKYQSYLQSCRRERNAAIREAVAREFKRIDPGVRDQRQRAFEMTVDRIDGRYRDRWDILDIRIDY